MLKIISEIKKLFPNNLDEFIQKIKIKIKDNLLSFYKIDNFGKK